MTQEPTSFVGSSRLPGRRRLSRTRGSLVDEALQPEDVYGVRTYRVPDSDNAVLRFWSVRVGVERSPLSLPRVFGLLATLNIVPVSVRSVLPDDDTLEIEIGFANIAAATADRLCRKIQQLTETVEWSVVQAEPKRSASSGTGPAANNAVSTT